MEIIGDVQDSMGVIGHYDAAVQNQEVHLLCSQIVLLHHEVADSWVEVERQLFTLKQKIGQMTNNVTCLSDRNAFVLTVNGSKRRQIITMLMHPNQKKILQWRLHVHWCWRLA